MKDISSGGVACEYAVFGEYGYAEDAEVDIFTSDPEHLMLRRVPCKVVYDIGVDQLSFSGIETRRSGLKFDRLSQQQCELLNLLLINCVSHPLLDKLEQ